MGGEGIQVVKNEVTKLVGKAYKKCKSMLQKNRRLLDALAEKLIEKETVDFVELYDLVPRSRSSLKSFWYRCRSSNGRTPLCIFIRYNYTKRFENL